MPSTTLSGHEFNRDIGRAKKATGNGPVFITDRGRPAHVLLSIEDYRKLTRVQTTLAAALAQHGEADFEFEPLHARGLYRTADLP
jgi:PHD/YefM family antitoxin component YafN of YafNO toxin-antitoxin module